MCGSSGNTIVGNLLSGGATAVLDETGNSNLPGGATTNQVRKSFYDPLGLFGGGGDQLWSKAGFTGKGKTPDVVTQDPAADAARAAAEAQARTNRAAVVTRGRRANSSLTSTSPSGTTMGGGVASSLSYGKRSLGG